MKIKKSSIEQVSEEHQEGAYISERLRNPATFTSGNSDSGKDTLYGVCAILATVAMIVVTVVLYLNWDAFEKTGLFIR